MTTRPEPDVAPWVHDPNGIERATERRVNDDINVENAPRHKKHDNNIADRLGRKSESVGLRTVSVDTSNYSCHGGFATSESAMASHQIYILHPLTRANARAEWTSPCSAVAMVGDATAGSATMWWRHRKKNEIL